MKHTETNLKIGYKTYPIVMEEFESTAELHSICKSRECNFASEHDYFGNVRISNSTKEWANFSSCEELMNMLDNGSKNKKAIANVKQGIQVGRRAESKRVQFCNGVAGFAPIVPMAIMGLPQSMINVHTVVLKSRIVEIVWDVSISAYVRPEDVEKASIEVLRYVLSLEMQGYRVRLRAISGFCSEKKSHFCSVIIKRENQPMDIARILYPTNDVSFDRGVMFAWYVRCPGAVHLSAFGYPPYIQFEDDLDTVYKSLFGTKVVPFSISKIIHRGMTNEEIHQAVEVNLKQKVEDAQTV